MVAGKVAMMSDNEVERGRAKQDWFLEHGSIQAELMKLKKEALRPKAEEIKKKDDQANALPQTTPSVVEGPSGQGPKESSGPEPAEMIDGTRPVENVPEPPKVERVDDVVKEVTGEGSDGKAPRLPTGKIPTAPNLTQKIASVIQLENKLKRRKYEMERSNRAKDTRSEESATVPTEMPEVKGTSPVPGPEIVPITEIEKGGTMAVPQDLPGTAGNGPVNSAPPPVPDRQVQDMEQPRTDLDLDTGREVKDAVLSMDQEGRPTIPDQEVPTPDVAPQMSDVEPRPEAQTLVGPETLNDGPVEGADNLPPEGVPRKGPDNGHDIMDDGSKPVNGIEEERLKKGRNGNEWLEVSRGPKRSVRKEDKGSSPLGRIINLFRKKGR